MLTPPITTNRPHQQQQQWDIDSVKNGVYGWVYVHFIWLTRSGQGDHDRDPSTRDYSHFRQTLGGGMAPLPSTWIRQYLYIISR